jgi:hypothetical protein
VPFSFGFRADFTLDPGLNFDSYSSLGGHIHNRVRVGRLGLSPNLARALDVRDCEFVSVQLAGNLRVFHFPFVETEQTIVDFFWTFSALLFPFAFTFSSGFGLSAACGVMAVLPWPGAPVPTAL